MEFRDLKDIDFLTIKADLLISIHSDSLEVKNIIEEMKHGNIVYDEIFTIILNVIRSQRNSLSVDRVVQLISVLNEVYEVEDNAQIYIDLLKCYMNEDIENYNVVELFNDDFIKIANLNFLVLFASYYLNVLIERSENIDEINRVNVILKNALMEYKQKQGR